MLSAMRRPERSPTPIHPADHQVGPPPARHAVHLGVLLLLIALAFGGALQCQLVNWDDEPLLLHNDKYRALAWDNLRWMFTTPLGGHYQPLTWLSYALDVKLWGGISPWGST